MIEFLATNYKEIIIIIIMLAGMASYAIEKISLELTSLVILSALLLHNSFIPIQNIDGTNILKPTDLFGGFANAGLITILSMSIMAAAIIRTGALNDISRRLIMLNNQYHSKYIIILVLLVAMILSGFLNNTPIVIIMIPIISNIAVSMGLSNSRVMIPLSYMAILGGTLTVIGTSTNLLISTTLEDIGLEPFEFFDFILPATIVCFVASIYILFILPRFLPNRDSSILKKFNSTSKEHEKDGFVIEFDVESAEYCNIAPETFEILNPGIIIKTIQRENNIYVTPFDQDFILKKGDIVIGISQRESISRIIQNNPNLLLSRFPNLLKKISNKQDINSKNSASKLVTKNDTMLAEIMVAPNSKLIGVNLKMIAFNDRHSCVVLGVKRRGQIVRSQLSEIEFESGDVLLVFSTRDNILSLTRTKDVIVVEFSAENMPVRAYSKSVNIIFLGVILLSVFNILPIVIASFLGAVAVIAIRAIDLRGAVEAINLKLVLVIVTAIAMSTMLYKSGLSDTFAYHITKYLSNYEPLIILSILFLVIMFVNEFMTNNASALIFTPIAVNVATYIDAPMEMFTWGMVFASSCSFSTPIGYQTNLLVMGPGSYKFIDYVKAGLPLNFIVCITYLTFCYFYF